MMYLLIKHYPWFKSCSRLTTSVVRRSFSTNSSQILNSFQKKIRNIGLVAHIDAGKTTTTERMLYYSGSSEHVGEVHHGDTVMDFMEQERERGITITMAAATIEWKTFQINLIDTPGHVDFTFEVERSLSALDGTVVILDATVGVQAQTIKVWQQARKYQIPSLFYLNKMDKQSPSVEKCLASIEKKLGAQPILLQKPVFINSIFTGLIDLVNGTYFQWPSDYKQRNVIDQIPSQQLLLMDSQVDESEKLLDSDLEQHYKTELKSERENLIGKLCDNDEKLADYALSLNDISQIEPFRLIKSIRSACLQGSLFPVLLGGSYRNIGVQLLLDSICLYLPDPLERIQSKLIFEHYTKNADNPNASENFSALAFKIHYHKRLGLLTFLRIYSGSITPGLALFNLNRNSKERITKIYKPFADNFVELNGRVNFGDICAVSGFSSTITGDTLVHFSYENSISINETPFLTGIEIPEPVYYCSLECSSVSKLKELETALKHLTREDPSLKVIDDQNNQQLVIKGMGELHIEIIKDRIKREYGIDVETGPLQVSYKETIMDSANVTLEQSKTIGGVYNYVKISMQVKPKLGSTMHLDDNLFSEEDSEDFRVKKIDISSLVKIVNTKDHNLKNELTPLQLKAIYAGVSKVFENGPLYSFPVMDVEVFVHNFETTNKTLPAFMSSITSQCLNMALKKSRPIFMEPIMKVEIVAPNQFLGTIISDLARRRSQLATSDKEVNTIESTWKDEYTERHILAYVPLAEMFNYSTDLRTISSGMASFDFSIHSYRTMDENQTEQVIRKISGIE